MYTPSRLILLENILSCTHACQLVFLDLELTHLPEDQDFGPPDDSILEARRRISHTHTPYALLLCVYVRAFKCVSVCACVYVCVFMRVGVYVFLLIQAEVSTQVAVVITTPNLDELARESWVISHSSQDIEKIAKRSHLRSSTSVSVDVDSLTCSHMQERHGPSSHFTANASI
jgi:hypothetical protein